MQKIILPEGYRPSENEEYMNPMQLEYFRLKLQNWREELLDESRETLNHLKEENWNEPDLNDRASVETETTIELRTRDRYRKLIDKIETAITRIDKGDYGSTGCHVPKRSLRPKVAKGFCDRWLFTRVHAPFGHPSRRLPQRESHDQCQKQSRDSDHKEGDTPAEEFIQPAARHKSKQNAKWNAKRINAQRRGPIFCGKVVSDHRVRGWAAACLSDADADSRD